MLQLAGLNRTNEILYCNIIPEMLTVSTCTVRNKNIVLSYVVECDEK